MRASTVVLLTTLVLGCLAATATADRFVVFKLGDIEGDHEGGDFDGWTSAAYFEHNIPGIPGTRQLLQGKTPTETEGTHTPNKSYKGFTITKEIDVASPLLLQACARGQRFAEMKLALCSRSDGQITRQALFTLRDVRITSMTILGPGSGERPPGVAKQKAVVVIVLSAVAIGNNFEEVKVT